MRDPVPSPEQNPDATRTDAPAPTPESEGINRVTANPDPTPDQGAESIGEAVAQEGDQA